MLKAELNEKFEIIKKLYIEYLFDNINSEKISFEIEKIYFDLIDSEKEFYKGYLNCMLDSIRRMEDLRIEYSRFKECYKKSQYSYPIALTLLEGPFSHSQLSDILNIKKNQLSNIFNSLERYHIIISEKVGRNKYYTLSKDGELFINYVKNNENYQALEGSKKKGIVATNNDNKIQPKVALI